MVDDCEPLFEEYYNWFGWNLDNFFRITLAESGTVCIMYLLSNTKTLILTDKCKYEWLEKLSDDVWKPNVDFFTEKSYAFNQSNYFMQGAV